MNRETFLRQLADEAGKSLPAADVQALVAEARDHLDDSIQARLELGLTAEEAEWEAIAAFGTARRVGREVARQEPWVDRRFLAAVVGLVLVVLGTIHSPAHVSDGVACAFGALIILAHVALVVASVYPRRFQVATLAFVYFSLGLGYSIQQAETQVYVPTPGGVYRISRAFLPHRVADSRASIDDLLRHAQTLREGYAEFRRNDSIRSPSPSGGTAADKPLRLYPRAARAEAEANWRSAIGKGDEYVRTAIPMIEDGIRRLKAAAHAPWWLAIPFEIGHTVTEFGGFALAYTSLYAIAWLSGGLIRRRNRRRKGTTSNV